MLCGLLCEKGVETGGVAATVVDFPGVGVAMMGFKSSISV